MFYGLLYLCHFPALCTSHVHWGECFTYTTISSVPSISFSGQQNNSHVLALGGIVKSLFWDTVTLFETQHRAFLSPKAFLCKKKSYKNFDSPYFIKKGKHTKPYFMLERYLLYFAKFIIFLMAHLHYSVIPTERISRCSIKFTREGNVDDKTKLNYASQLTCFLVVSSLFRYSVYSGFIYRNEAFCYIPLLAVSAMKQC